MKKKMICRNCKKEVKDNAIYCPYCGKKLKKKKGRILFLICIFLLVLLSAGICFWKLHNDHITKQKEKTGTGKTVKYSDGDYVYVPDSESIKVDEKVEIVYYDNLITVYLEKNTSDEEKEALAKLLDGDIVSNISGCINMIEVEVESTDYSGIQKKIGNILDEKCVRSAMCSIPVAIENETSKVWDGESDLGNESDPKGADWWAEAVGAYTAWDYDSLTDPIVVGVVDNGFEVMHEDLQRDEKSVITMLNENSIDMKKNSPEHGTHVAGLIGAQDNSIGMRGIADKAEIVCADWQLSDGTTLLTPATISKIYESMIEYAKKQNKPIVINNSWGTSISILYLFSRVTTYGEEHMPKEYKFLLSCAALEIVEQLLEANNKDFIIVQAAGNGYSNGLVGYNAEESGWFCGITPQLKEQYKKRFSKSIRFTYETIKSHIMIVGAVQNNKNQGAYQLTRFSNYGDSVDIVAPGKKIYSTVLKNKYGYLDGTSMAAPIVSGAAAYLWSLNRDLSADEVKQKLINTAGKAQGVLDDDKRKEYPMLNLKAAIEKITENDATHVTLENHYIKQDEDSYDLFTSGNEQYAIITGLDENENVIWTIETGKSPATELPSTMEIGIHEGRYYYEHDGIIYAIRLRNGEEIWHSASAHGTITGSDFGPDGTLYYCSFYGPDFGAIDKEGNEIVEIERFFSEYYWANELCYRGNYVDVNMGNSEFGDGTIIRVNLSDYSYSVIKP